MHILIDLQGAQSNNSRHRGIGNYSEAFALRLARMARGKHRVSLLLNAVFYDTIAPIRQAFTGLIEPADFYIWEPLSPCRAHEPDNTWRRKASEGLYAAFVASIHADILLVTSLFEGYGDDAIIALPQKSSSVLTAVVLFDLILKIYPKPYLENPLVSAWYHGRLAQARQADLLLAISASSAQEAIDHLDRQPTQVINISSAVDSRFHVIKVGAREEASLRARYGLHRQFVMYTGGIDYRKNIEGLLAAYAALPDVLRTRHQLAVVCSITEPARMKLAELARQLGLADDEIIFTGYVPDSDLVTLYNLCTLFVFPSWHEGFGLPALEAMACGAPTLTSNRSSLPEVVGRPDALFDPFDYGSMARAIERGLTDKAYRANLKEHGLRQAKKFSWDATAGRALEALEALQTQRIESNAFAPIHALPLHARKPRLAFVSPLQPAKSGIADYSAALLPALAAHYDIDVIVEQADLVSDRWVLGNAFQRSVAWFEVNAKKYDRILYQMGNSQFHQHMLGLLEKFPGVVVLHDFFLSGLQVHQDITGIAPGAWARELLRAHGWSALKERFEAKDTANVIYSWPCNLDVLQRALGVIVHADHSSALAEQWYGPNFANDWVKIPLLRTPAANTNRNRARARLNLSADDILVCSFGFVGKSKLNHLLIQAWLASDLAQDERCHLIFVGYASGEYGEQIQRQCQAGHGRIHITGWTDDERYEQYLSAADIAVQLRTLSRGETSAAALDCMNYGIATIVNAHGSMAELPRDAVWMIDDGFTTEALAEALNLLRHDPERRSKLAARAHSYIRAEHLPSTCATQYAGAIERFYARAEQGLLGLARNLSALGQPQDNADLLKLAEVAAQIFPPPRPAGRQLLIDISSLQAGGMNSSSSQIVSKVLHHLLQNPPDGVRIEPVYATTEHFYRYARNFTAKLLGLGDVPLDDAPIFTQPRDVFWGLDFAAELVSRHQASLISLRLRGTRIVFSAHDLLPILHPELSTAYAAETHSKWLQALAIVSDGIISASSTVSTELKE